MVKKIMVVSDERRVRGVVATTLGEEEFLVLQAKNGPEVLDLVRTGRPDLVLLDLNVPQMHGLEICRALKTDPSTAGIKVIVLTVRSDPGDEAAARRAGAYDYLSKPFSPIALLTKVREVLK